MIHKISDFDPSIIVVQIHKETEKGRTVDLMDYHGVECFAFSRDGKVPMVVIDARKSPHRDVLLSLEARGVCAVKNFQSLEKNLHEALNLLQQRGNYGAAKIIEKEMETFNARKICKIGG